MRKKSNVTTKWKDKKDYRRHPKGSRYRNRDTDFPEVDLQVRDTLIGATAMGGFDNLMRKEAPKGQIPDIMKERARLIQAWSDIGSRAKDIFRWAMKFDDKFKYKKFPKKITKSTRDSRLN